MKLFTAHWSAKDINTFLLRLEVKHKDCEEAAKCLQKPYHNDDHHFELLRVAAANSDLPMLKLLLANGGDLTTLKYEVIRHVGTEDHDLIVGYLETVKENLEDNTKEGSRYGFK